jgi:hypothetical protein
MPQGAVIYALSSDAPKSVLNWFKPSASSSSQSSLRAVHSGTYPFPPSLFTSSGDFILFYFILKFRFNF